MRNMTGNPDRSPCDANWVCSWPRCSSKRQITREENQREQNPGCKFLWLWNQKCAWGLLIWHPKVSCEDPEDFLLVLLSIFQWSGPACKYFSSSLTVAGIFCTEFCVCEGAKHVCSRNPEAPRETDSVRRKVKVRSWEGSRSNGERLLPLSFETPGMGCSLKLWEFRLITGAVALKPGLCRHWQLWDSVEKRDMG